MNFSYRGDRLVSGGSDGTVRMWDAKNRQPLGDPLRGHKARVSKVLINVDGTVLVSADDDGTILTWDAIAGKPLGKPITEFPAARDGLSLSPDGSTLALIVQNKIVLWDIRSGRPLTEPLTYGETLIRAVAFSPDGTKLVAGNGGGKLALWHQSGQQISASPDVVQITNGPILSLDFSADSQTVAVASTSMFGGQYEVSRWDLASLRRVEVYSIWDSGVPARSKVMCGFNTKKLWLIVNANTRYTLDPEMGYDVWSASYSVPQWISSTRLSPNGQVLAAGDYGGTVALWDVAQRAPIEKPLVAHLTSVTGLAFDPTGKILATAAADGEIRLWDIERRVPIVSSLKRHDALVTRLTFSSDGRLMASGSEDGKVHLWNVKKETMWAELAVAGQAGVTDLVFGLKDQLLAVVMTDGQISLWDLGAEEPQQVDMQQIGTTTFGSVVAAFSTDGKRLVAADGTSIAVWKVKDKQLIDKAVVSHSQEGRVTDLTLSADGEALALTTMSSDGEAVSTLAWNIEQQRPLSPPLTGAGKGVAEVAFSEDAHVLMVVYTDGTVSESDLTQAFAWIDHICQLVNRNLEQSEWVQAIGLDAPYEPVCPDLPIPQSVISDISRSARTFVEQGRVNEAIAEIQKVQNKNPKLQFNATKAVASGLVESGAQKAGKGDYAGAVALWHKALDLDPEAEIVPTLDVATYLNQKPVADVVQFITQIADLKPVGMFDPARAVAWELMKLARKRSGGGAFERALEATTEAAQQDLQIATFMDYADVYYNICWGGVTSGTVEAVYPACEKAVAIEPDNAVYRSMRGVARALRKDYRQAIEDFEFYLEKSELPDSKLSNPTGVRVGLPNSRPVAIHLSRRPWRRSRTSRGRVGFEPGHGIPAAWRR